MSYIIHQSKTIVNTSPLLSASPKKVELKDLKIVFLGTPEFALPALERLINSEYKPSAVFCAPDKPVGRKQVLTPPPTKTLAQKLDIPIYQPANSNELAETIKSIPVDLIVSAAYGLILPKEVLEAPKFGCLNLHPSLLPKYRGASPLQSTILNGDSETGVTIYQMDEKMDTGLILINGKWQMTNDKITTPELSSILADLGAKLLLEILPQWIGGKIKPEPQDNSQATYTKIIKKEDGRINWQKSAKELEQQIRAYTPWPGSHSSLGGSQIIKILKAEAKETSRNKQTGEIFLDEKNNLSVQAGQGYLILIELQLEGKKPTNTQDFLRGHKEIIGKVLN